MHIGMCICMYVSVMACVRVCMHVCGCVHGGMRVYMCMCSVFFGYAHDCICALIVDVRGLVTTHICLVHNQSHILPSLLG